MNTYKQGNSESKVPSHLLGLMCIESKFVSEGGSDLGVLTVHLFEKRLYKII